MIASHNMGRTYLEHVTASALPRRHKSGGGWVALALILAAVALLAGAL